LDTSCQGKVILGTKNPPIYRGSVNSAILLELCTGHGVIGWLTNL
jgi:hypothetical protein